MAGRGPQELRVAAEMSWLVSPATAASGVAAGVRSADSARPGPWAAGGTWTNSGYLRLAPHTSIHQPVMEVRHDGLQHNSLRRLTFDQPLLTLSKLYPCLAKWLPLPLPPARPPAHIMPLSGSHCPLGSGAPTTQAGRTEEGFAKGDSPAPAVPASLPPKPPAGVLRLWVPGWC